MTWKKLAYILYPILIAILLPLLFFMTLQHEKEARAGVIRSASLTTDHPLVIRLAMGRSTAVTFPTRPEKVVPGNPQAVEINFLGRDLTLRPLGQKPGNLIVYSKSGRYVILLQMVSDSSYDDAVLVNSISTGGRPLRLIEDTFVVEDIRTVDLPSKKESHFSALIKNAGRTLESDSLPTGIRCKGCVVRIKQESAELMCQLPIKKLDCRCKTSLVELERKTAGS